MNNDAKTNARDAYHARADEIENLLDDLRMELKLHAEECFALRPSAKRSQELDRVKADLVQTAEFIRNARRQEIKSRSAQ